MACYLTRLSCGFILLDLSLSCFCITHAGSRGSYFHGLWNLFTDHYQIIKLQISESEAASTGSLCNIIQLHRALLGYNHQIMDIRQLTEKMNQLVDHHGWYDLDSPKAQTPRNLAISLCLETAEVLEHFQWSEKPKNKPEFEGELADVALYLLQIASVSGIDLEQAILTKIEQNWDRVWQEDQEMKMQE